MSFPVGQFFGEGGYVDSSALYPADFGTLAVTPGATYALPFIVHRASDLQSARVRVSSGAAGTVKGALYAVYPNVAGAEYPAYPGYPSSLIAESNVERDTSEPGNKILNFGLGVSLDPGLYYLAVQFSAAPTVVSIQATASGLYAGHPVSRYSGVYDPNTTYGTFVDPFNNDNWGLYDNPMPYVFVTLVVRD